MKTLKLTAILFCLLGFTVPQISYAKKTAEEKRAAREKRKAERKAKREKRKKSYGISWTSKKGKCKKNKGSMEKSACKAQLRSECSGKKGWKMGGSSCKKKRGYSIKPNGKKSKYKCKKDSGSSDDKASCKSKLASFCQGKASEGFEMRGSSCKKKKLKTYEIRENGKKTKKSCKKAKGANKGKKPNGTTLFADKNSCKAALAKACTGDGWEMKGSRCKKKKIKTYMIKENNKKTKKSCKKTKGADKTKKPDGTTIFKDKNSCTAVLQKSCTGDGWSMKGKSCKKGKVNAYVFKEAGKSVKCSKAKKNSTGTKYKSKQECISALQKMCSAKPEDEGFKWRGSKCTTSGGLKGLISDKLNEVDPMAMTGQAKDFGMQKLQEQKEKQKEDQQAGGQNPAGGMTRAEQSKKCPFSLDTMNKNKEFFYVKINDSCGGSNTYRFREGSLQAGVKIKAGLKAGSLCVGMPMSEILFKPDTRLNNCTVKSIGNSKLMTPNDYLNACRKGNTVGVGEVDQNCKARLLRESK